jgi:hypothetical protein
MPDSAGNTFYHKKGTIMEFDDQKKADVPTLAALRAAGRIVPPTKENLIQCKAELDKAIRKQKEQPKRDGTEVRNPISIPDELTAALAEATKPAAK